MSLPARQESFEGEWLKQSLVCTTRNLRSLLLVIGSVKDFSWAEEFVTSTGTALYTPRNEGENEE